jgi:glycosyltransferase involved in cell wall biosynthesis
MTAPANASKRRTGLKLLLVTDAWEPQTNGVVTTLKAILRHLPGLGIDARVVHPGLFDTWPLPSYPEIRIARNPGRVGEALDACRPDAVHIATEGPLGMAGRRACLKRGIAFTTAVHTKFPEYVNARIGLPLSVGYRFMRWFHGPAASTLCTTESHRIELENWGLTNVVVWGRGVDTELFRPVGEVGERDRPRLLYVGRVAVEKNIEAFLSLELDADKVVVGDGPARRSLEASHPEVSWLGYRRGRALVDEYARADAFVFPSRTDTFGLVMLEAMACGTPVAAFPVTGPRDVVVDGVNGALDEDLSAAVQRALRVPRRACRDFAEANSWRRIAERFAAVLALPSGARLSSWAADRTMVRHDGPGSRSRRAA